jgi:putative transcriptional regulator
MLDNNIAKHRGRLKISQQDLADGIGVSRKTISTVETRRFTPSVVIALKLAAYFQVTVESIFSFEE